MDASSVAGSIVPGIPETASRPCEQYVMLRVLTSVQAIGRLQRRSRYWLRVAEFSQSPRLQPLTPACSGPQARAGSILVGGSWCSRPDPV